MIELQYKDDVYKVKNDSKEISIKLFQEIINKSQESPYYFEQWLNIISILSDKKGVEKLISEEDFYKIVKHLTFKDIDIVDSIEIDGVEYKAEIKNNKPKLSAWTFSKLEKVVKDNPENWMAKCMAIIFENEEINVDKREELFNEKMTIDIALPFLLNINQSLITNIKNLENE